MSESLHMPKTALKDLIATLWREGFQVLGPVARDGAVAFDEVRKVSELAVAMRDTQEPGRYRLVQGAAGEIFGVVNVAGSLKPLFSAPEETLLEVNRERRGFKVSEVAPAAVRLAFIGVRACDLAAARDEGRRRFSKIFSRFWSFQQASLQFDVFGNPRGHDDVSR
jgi:hypothetical protein